MKRRSFLRLSAFAPAVGALALARAVQEPPPVIESGYQAQLIAGYDNVRIAPVRDRIASTSWYSGTTVCASFVLDADGTWG